MTKKVAPPDDLKRLLTLRPESIAEMTFETAMENLERIVEALETEGTPLDVGLKLYEVGNELGKKCTQALDATEARMVQLMGAGDQESEVPFDPEKDGR